MKVGDLVQYTGFDSYGAGIVARMGPGTQQAGVMWSRMDSQTIATVSIFLLRVISEST
tara:strand:+ start:366 stop:539 length:174 start_codon:yes stop_codon:yes gene_type:complete